MLASVAGPTSNLELDESGLHGGATGPPHRNAATEGALG
jgi:hypothetical protein